MERVIQRKVKDENRQGIPDILVVQMWSLRAYWCTSSSSFIGWKALCTIHLCQYDTSLQTRVEVLLKLFLKMCMCRKSKWWGKCAGNKYTQNVLGSKKKLKSMSVHTSVVFLFGTEFPWWSYVPDLIRLTHFLVIFRAFFLMPLFA